MTGEHPDHSDGSDILISIVNYRTAQHCIACLLSLASERQQLPNLRVVVADGASGDQSVTILSDWIAKERHADWITLVPLGMNGGFGWAHNQIILHALQSDDAPAYIYLLNPDTIVEPGAVAALRRVFSRDTRIACVGSQLINTDGSLGGSAFRFPGIRREFASGAGVGKIEKLLGIGSGVIFADQAQPVDWVTGASVMIRSEALREAGLFDDGFFLYSEEMELMHRMKRMNWKIWHEPNSRVIHEGGAATGVETGNVRTLKRLPRYCYISRRRYFALTHGQIGALLAGVAWLAGRSMRKILAIMLRRKPTEDIPYHVQDFRSVNFVAKQSDLAPATVSWRAEPGSPPAWIELYGEEMTG